MSKCSDQCLRRGVGSAMTFWQRKSGLCSDSQERAHATSKMSCFLHGVKEIYCLTAMSRETVPLRVRSYLSKAPYVVHRLKV